MPTNSRMAKASPPIPFEVGSTTVKAVVMDSPDGEILWKKYLRHNTKQTHMVRDFLGQLQKEFPDRRMKMFITGSGGRVIAPFINGRYVQEVNAVTYAVEKRYTCLNCHRGDVYGPKALAADEVAPLSDNLSRMPHGDMWVDDGGNISLDSGSRISQAGSLTNLGRVCSIRCEYKKAEELYLNAIKIYKDAPDILGEANCMKNYGDLKYRTAKYEDAERF